MAKQAKKNLTKTQIALRERLETERGELVRQLEELGSQRASESADGRDEIGDPVDAGTATYQREQDRHLGQSVRAMLDQVDHALSRLEEGTYGSCERCGKKIEAARLKALPHASLCIECKKRDERRW